MTAREHAPTTSGSPPQASAGAATATWLVAWRGAALLAMAASAALYIQYLNPAAAAFCGLSSGCEAVRRSGFSYFGTPLLSIPLVGLLAYGAVFGSSVVARRAAWPVWLTAFGGVVALGLIATQAFVVQAFCWLCLVVDVSAIAAALFAIVDLRRRPADLASEHDPLRLPAWVAFGICAVVAPVLWANVKPALPVPDTILALYEPGKINVVEFQDFECPFCRKLFPVIKHVAEAYPPDRLHFLRKHVPLPSHEDARPAARAAVCAEQQGKGEALAERLVEIELSAVAIRRAAAGSGVDLDRFDRCLASKDPDARIDADTKLLEDAGMAGLPTTYVGTKRLLGAVSEAALRDAFDRAARGDSDRGVPAAVFVPGLLLLLGLVAWLGRSRRVMVRDERSG